MDPKKMSSNMLEDFLNSLISNIPFGIIAMDQSGCITLINRLSKNFLNLKSSLDDLPGLRILDCIEHIPVLSGKLADIFKNENASFDLEAEDISGRYLNINGRKILNGYILIINDITVQKEMEANAVNTIIAGQENERKRLAREIHDGIGPLLSIAKLELDSFIDEYKDINMKLPMEKLDKIRETIDSITSDLRNLSHHLLPKLLDEFGLFSAFSSLTSRINSSNKTNIEFYCNFNSETRFDKDIELNLYRCGQELVNNAVKHSRAKEIMVQIIKHPSSIILMVEDDGAGFKKGESNPDQYGIGLVNIETRVRTLNGVFIIESVKNKGAVASIEIPL